MAYEDPLIEQRKFDNIEQWTQNVFRPLGVPPPAYIEGEHLDHQRKRIMEKARPYVSEELQQIRRDDVFGTGLNHLEKQFMASAAAEATRPTKVPDGELKEVKKYDQSGRASSEFYGSPKVWMSTFSSGRKQVVGIRVANERGYRPSNVG